MKKLKVVQFFNLDQVKISKYIYPLFKIAGKEACVVVNSCLLLRFEASDVIEGKPEDWELDIQNKTLTKIK